VQETESVSADNPLLQTSRVFNPQKTKSKQWFLKPLYAKLAIHVKTLYLFSIILLHLFQI
jgi:hypothetical protein